MRIIVALLLLFAINCYAQEPMFISKEGVHQAMLGQTIDLPCEVAELGDYTVYWSKEGNSDSGEAIFADRTKMINDERFEFATKEDDPKNWTIRINEIEGYDQGIYRCMISTVPEQMSQKQILSVKVPASVNIVPEKSPYSVEAGSMIQLACYPSGNPLPTIVWTRRAGPLPDGTASHEGRDYVIERATSRDQGTYKCTANNGVGEPAEAEIAINIVQEGVQQYAPKVNATTTDVIHVKLNGALNITCLYTASPDPHVEWFHDNYPIENNPAKKMKKHEVHYEAKEDYTLTYLSIYNITVEDFGDYKCKVTNNLGTDDKTMHITGKPLPAQLDVRENPDGALLSWTIDSIEPILEYKVEYKMIGGIGDKEFQTVSIKNELVHDASRNDLTYKGSHILTGLESERDYEISLVARNQNGWGSPPIAPYHFKTGLLKKPKSENTDDKTPPKVKDTEIGKKANGSCSRISSISAIFAISLSLVIRLICS